MFFKRHRGGKYLAEVRQWLKDEKQSCQCEVDVDSWQWFVRKEIGTQFAATITSVTYFRRASLS